MDIEALNQKFKTDFGSEPDCIVRAPGRVNLIGEHIDYNGGPVLPIAIDKHFLIAGKARPDQTVRLKSLQESEPFEGPLPVQNKVKPEWSNYPLGVIHEIAKSGHSIKGFDALITSDVPLGSGLSSSAAFEVATAKLLMYLNDIEIEPLEIAQLCQRAENEFVGVNCGLMDQAASACCKKDHALLLDCARPACEWHPLPEVAVVVAHSGVRRGLSASAYNKRRSQCEEALNLINQRFGKGYPDLCCVPHEMMHQLPHNKDDILLRRSRHVIGETARVHEVIHCFREGELERAGELLNQSHYSLRDDYDVSCPELDELTTLCREFEGVYGSRLTGAGFGGCTVTLIDPSRAEALLTFLDANYYQPKSLEPIAFITQAAAGAEVVVKR